MLLRKSTLSEHGDHFTCLSNYTRLLPTGASNYHSPYSWFLPRSTFLMSGRKRSFMQAYLTPLRAWHVPQIIPANRFPFSFLRSVRSILAAFRRFVCNDFQFLTSRLWNNIISEQTSLYSYTAKTTCGGRRRKAWDEFFTRLYSSIKNLNRSISLSSLKGIPKWLCLPSVWKGLKRDIGRKGRRRVGWMETISGFIGGGALCKWKLEIVRRL